jgi:hypothetical protein
MVGLPTACRDTQEGRNLREKVWVGRRRAEIRKQENGEGDGRRNEYERKEREKEWKEKRSEGVGRGQLNN